MEKLLLIGINTRSMIESGLKLNYTIYSTSYFSTSDVPSIENQKIILDESINPDCGVFEDKFSSENILNVSKDYLDEVDYIIPISGISPNNFKKKHQKKILGNKDISKVEDKYRYYKEIRNEFLTPETFYVNDVDEAVEIQKVNDNDVSEQLDKIVSCIQRVDVTLPDGSKQSVKDKMMIAQWVEQVNPKDFRVIIEHFTKVNKIGTVMDLDVKCSHCGYKEKTDVVVDITNFFSEED